MDDEQDSQADHSSPMPEFANPFIDGIRAPAPIYDDAHDENGDYLAGPQAAHDEYVTVPDHFHHDSLIHILLYYYANEKKKSKKA